MESTLFYCDLILKNCKEQLKTTRLVNEALVTQGYIKFTGIQTRFRKFKNWLASKNAEKFNIIIDYRLHILIYTKIQTNFRFTVHNKAQPTRAFFF